MFDPYPLISVGSVSFSTHGVLFAAGALAAMALASFIAKRKGLEADLVPLWTLLIFAAGLVVARLSFVLSYPSLHIHGPEVFQIWDGGLVSFGGLIGGAMMIWYLLKNQPKNDRSQWLMALIPATLLGWAIGRLGNYYAFESFGVVSDVWELTYGRVPIQLFESLGCVLLAIAGVYAAKRNTLWLTLSLVPAYFVLRFAVDFWRDETIVNGLRISQWTSLILLVVSGIYALWARSRH